MSLGGTIEVQLVAFAGGNAEVESNKLELDADAFSLIDFRSGEKRIEGCERIPIVEGSRNVFVSWTSGMYCVIGLGGGDINAARVC